MEGALEKVTETWVALAKPPTSGTFLDACLVRIYPTGPGMGARFPLGTSPVTLGRDGNCDVQVNDQSASRRHACVKPGADGHYAVDLQSTNGTYVNDQPAATVKLRDGDYLRIGNNIFRYLVGGNVEAEYHEEIYRLTIIDALTGIHNKRFLTEFLDRELARSARYKRPLALVMLDIDLFRTVNERLGHLGGDFTLRELVARVKQAIRKEELFARYGGEEFVLVLPETNQEGALDVAERIRALVGEHPFVYEDHTYQLTVSVGVAATAGEEALTPDDLVRLADDHLYRAKNAGRNRVCG